MGGPLFLPSDGTDVGPDAVSVGWHHMDIGRIVCCVFDSVSLATQGKVSA
jgi:hypothetical protein